MSCFEDYEVLSILGTNLNSTCYKVKNKLTSEVFVWKAINYETYAAQSDGVLAKINRRRLQINPSLLNFYDYILHEETHTVYLVTEYCKHGSFANIIQKCLKNNQYINEDLIWSILYKLAMFYKSNQQMERPNIYDTFVDVKCEMRLLNFALETAANCTIYDLGVLLHQITYLSHCYDPNASFPEYYSNDLHNLLKFLTNSEPDVTPTIESILCHPTVLRKQGTDKNYEMFVDNPSMDQVKSVTATQNDTNESYERLYQVKLENLRKRDAQLKLIEQKLQERERNIDKREKKVALQERIVKEKIARADVYLRRARDIKPSVKAVKPAYDRQDTSFSADCGESTIMPTSRKLDVKEIPKPAKFTRAMSERRVRFKSHSPLKEIHNIKRDFAKPLPPSLKKRLPELPEVTMNLKRLELDSDSSEKSAPKPKKKFALSSMFTSKKAKKPNSIASSSDSVSAHTYEDLDKGWDDFRHDLHDCRPINWSENTQSCEQPQWTDDSKKQAFDLLRIMNQEDVVEIKHTFL